MADWQSLCQVPVSQPRPILPMQPGARVDPDTRVGVSVGIVVDVGVGAGVDSSTVTGVFVGVGVWVGVAVGAGDPLPARASSLAVSLSISALRDAIRPRWVSIWSRCVFTWFCRAPTWLSSWVILALALPDEDTLVAVRVGVRVGTSGRVVVGTEVRVGVAVGGVPVAVGVAVGGVPVAVGVLVDMGVCVGVLVDVGVWVGVAVAETPVGVRVGVAMSCGNVVRLPQHATVPLARSPQVEVEPALIAVKVSPAGGLV